ncbi:MAG: hypothetical protein AMJ54_01220 [Deltaproteobacteria bacterium SG8_13]|nr:MAG: hypothetical protein AMJ54_01220 [Deltaproteobacteria bacterium SG8_13]
MSATKQKEAWVRVKDLEGSDFICPLSALKDPGQATEEELESCVDSATAGRYAGHITIAD